MGRVGGDLECATRAERIGHRVSMRGGGTGSKRGMLVVAGAVIKERNCADHAHSSTTVRMCGRVENALGLFATLNEEVMQS